MSNQVVAAKKERMRLECKDGTAALTVTQEQTDRINAALGTMSADSLTIVMAPVLNAIRKPGQSDETLLNGVIELIEKIGPRDTIEAGIATQMVATQLMSLNMMACVHNANFADQLNAYGNLATKSTRTYCALVETLNKHRRGGKQIVEHLHFHAGGQAVVAGTVNARGVGTNDAGQGHGARGYAERATVRGEDAAGDLLQLASHAERAMPTPWGGFRRERPRGTGTLGSTA